MIKEYRFGEIIIEDKKYTTDIIIYKDKIISWWRKIGHLVQKEDLIQLIEEKPEIIIIGTGAYGVMKVPQKVIEELTQKGAKVIVCPTKEAINKYNRLNEENKKVGAAFHLTC